MNQIHFFPDIFNLMPIIVNLIVYICIDINYQVYFLEEQVAAYQTMCIFNAYWQQGRTRFLSSLAESTLHKREAPFSKVAVESWIIYTHAHPNILLLRHKAKPILSARIAFPATFVNLKFQCYKLDWWAWKANCLFIYFWLDLTAWINIECFLGGLKFKRHIAVQISTF